MPGKFRFFLLLAALLAALSQLTPPARAGGGDDDFDGQDGNGVTQSHQTDRAP